MENPIVINLDNIFNKDNKLEIIVLCRESNIKLKKLAKGNINIYKKYFNFNDKYSVEKWIFLDINIETSKKGATILQSMTATGKISMKMVLLNPPKEIPEVNLDNKSVISNKTHGSVYSQALKNNLKNISNTKENVKSNKSERFRSITEHNNEFLKKLKTRKAEDIFGENYVIDELDEKKLNGDNEDGLSEVTISEIDGNENDTHFALTKLDLKIDKMISLLREKYEKNFEKIIPENITELKIMIKKIHSHIDILCRYYISNLNSLRNINLKLKYQANNYYEKYLEIYKIFNKEREEKRNLEKILQNETKVNIQENEIIKELIDNFGNELQFFKSDCGVKLKSDLPKDEDLITLIDILSSVQDDIQIPEELNKSEFENIKDVLSFYQLSNDENNFSKKRKKKANEEKIKKILDFLNCSIEKHQKTMKFCEPIKIKSLSFHEYQLNEKKILIEIISDDEILVCENEGSKISFKEYLNKNFQSRITTPRNKKFSSFSFEKNVPSNVLIEKLKEEQMKIIENMNKLAANSNSNQKKNK